MLYVFGDSFSTANRGLEKRLEGLPDWLPLENSWTDIVSQKLTGSIEHINDAMSGCANEFIFQCFLNRQSEMKSGDCVIVQLTSMYRHWFFDNKPWLSNYTSTQYTIGHDISKEESTAIEMYVKYLFCQNRITATYNGFISGVTYISSVLAKENVRVLILPGFQPVYGVNGTLATVAESEFLNEKIGAEYYQKVQGDCRVNHLSEQNHIVLANKVYNFFKTGEMVDLTTEFKTGIFTKENI